MAWAAMARTKGVASTCASASSSSAARRAASTSSHAIRISTAALNIRDRARRCRAFLKLPADRRRRIVMSALRQTQQRQARVRRPPGFSRPAITGFSLVRARRATGEARRPGRGRHRTPADPAVRDSRSHASSASLSASGHTPWSDVTSARCTRHSPRYGTMSGCDSHQRVSACVHSRARPMSNRSAQADSTLQ